MLAVASIRDRGLSHPIMSNLLGKLPPLKTAAYQICKVLVPAPLNYNGPKIDSTFVHVTAIG